MSVSSVPGFDVLGLNSDGSSSQSTSPAPSSPSTSTTAPSAPSTENPYQQTYDQLQTWSAQYLMQAVEYGAPQIPQFTAGQSVDSFAALTNSLAALGTNINATA